MIRARPTVIDVLDLPVRAGEPKNRLSTATRVARAMGLTRAGEMLGQGALADAIGIEPRSLRAKIAVDRGITAHDLRAAAKALDVHAEAMRVLAGKLRDMADVADFDGR